jgi:hypothetical protein
MAATFSNVENLAALAARESTQNAMKLKVSTAETQRLGMEVRGLWRRVRWVEVVYDSVDSIFQNADVEVDN